MRYFFLCCVYVWRCTYLKCRQKKTSYMYWLRCNCCRTVASFFTAILFTAFFLHHLLAFSMLKLSIPFRTVEHKTWIYNINILCSRNCSACKRNHILHTLLSTVQQLRICVFLVVFFLFKILNLNKKSPGWSDIIWSISNYATYFTFTVAWFESP